MKGPFFLTMQLYGKEKSVKELWNLATKEKTPFSCHGFTFLKHSIAQPLSTKRASIFIKPTFCPSNDVIKCEDLKKIEPSFFVFELLREISISSNDDYPLGLAQ